jgi:regulator of RNase E activity RraB
MTTELRRELLARIRRRSREASIDIAVRELREAVEAVAGALGYSTGTEAAREMLEAEHLDALEKTASESYKQGYDDAKKEARDTTDVSGWGLP